MKILFFSDIHGIKKNLLKLEKVITKEKFDKIVVLGDLYNSEFNNKKGMFDNQEVSAFLTKYKEKLIITKGNCDSNLEIKTFNAYKDYTSICVDSITLYLTHGNEYNYYNSSRFDQKGILIYGHEHIPYVRKKNNMIYICVGSISLPRNDFGATYMIYENKKFTIYNIDSKIIDEYKIKEDNK